MKFKIIWTDYDGDHNESLQPHKITEAFPIVEIRHQERKLSEVKHSFPEAVLDENGKPVIVYRHEVRYELRDSYYHSNTPKETWLKEGFNHKFNDRSWERDVEVTTWWVEIETLEFFTDFVDKYNLDYSNMEFRWTS